MLALSLGRTHEELLNSISSEELTTWLAFHSLNPIGNDRADVNAAVIASTIANCHSKKHYKIDDFMPKYGQPKKDTLRAWVMRVGKVKQKDI